MSHAIAAAADLNAPPVTKILAEFVRPDFVRVVLELFVLNILSISVLFVGMTGY